MGFLLLKDEDESNLDFVPGFNKRRRLKISTFKIDAHRTSLGQRFLNIILKTAMNLQIDEIYVTLFPKQLELINLFSKFGFTKWGINSKTDEIVLSKNFSSVDDIYLDFPLIDISHAKYLLAILPKYHTEMFPDSRLMTEKNHMIEDKAYTNTIEKIYLTAAYNSDKIEVGDLITIYRTKDSDAKNAEYSSVAISLCTVVEIKALQDFENYDEFSQYCRKSIFSNSELKEFWNKKRYPYIIKILYNIPLAKRISRNSLVENVGISRDRIVCMKLSDLQFSRILKAGEVNESFIIDKTRIR